MKGNESNQGPVEDKRTWFWVPGSEPSPRKLFDYRALRFLMGLIALSFSWIVIFVSGEKLVSISSSYHTDAQDWFVGLNFAVAAFLWAYNGHYRWQGRLSRVGAVAAVVVALVPAACGCCEEDLVSRVHLVASGVLFGVLAFFCLVPFRKKIKGKKGKERRRSGIYVACGVIMVLALATAMILSFAYPAEIDDWRAIFWAEAIALHAFGAAWLTAGKVIPFLVDEKDRYRFWGTKRQFKVTRLTKINGDDDDRDESFVVKLRCEVALGDAFCGAFFVTAMNPAQLALELGDAGIELGHGILLAPTFDETRAKEKLQRLVDGSRANSWSELSEYLQRYFDVE